MIFTLLQAASQDDGFREWFRDHGGPVIGAIVTTIVVIVLVRILVPRVLRPATLTARPARPTRSTPRRGPSR